MKAKELAGFSVAELEKKSAELNQELFNLKFQHHTGHLEDSSKISKVRKDIARVNTFIRQKQA